MFCLDIAGDRLWANPRMQSTRSGPKIKSEMLSTRTSIQSSLSSDTCSARRTIVSSSCTTTAWRLPVLMRPSLPTTIARRGAKRKKSQVRIPGLRRSSSTARSNFLTDTTSSFFRAPYLRELVWLLADRDSSWRSPKTVVLESSEWEEQKSEFHFLDIAGGQGLEPR